ncbi:manganese peroxidase 1 precursor [Rickenella mellea]|uniref:Peroxidase n=1 Tax=Rickenella mellea TaxID=50990 RepID=A0A4Y7Q4X9_9AGAM|nr:manganese peroxidase 1 precursor [Rickenella mellea]
MAFKSLLASLVVVVAFLQASQAGVVNKRKTQCPGGSVHQAFNPACCTWFDVLDDLQTNVLFSTCGEASHSALRIVFHDAIGFSRTQKFGGGADGSIIMFGDTELEFAANNGIDEIAGDLKTVADAHGKSYGDIIQLAGAVGVANCAGAPRLSFLAGRPNATAPAPDGTVPDPFQPVDTILARMHDAGFSPDELVALLASHTMAAADKVDVTIPGTPFDSTANVFDSQFFIETQLKGLTFPGTGPNQGEVASPLVGEMRLQSDFALARDHRTACTWQSFVTNHTLMNQRFSDAMDKLSVLGQNTRHFLDCSEVIPHPHSLKVIPHLPAGKTMADIEPACAATPFPDLPTAPGPATTVKPVPPGS